MLIGHDSAGISQIKSREGIELLKDLYRSYKRKKYKFKKPVATHLILLWYRIVIMAPLINAQIAIYPRAWKTCPTIRRQIPSYLSVSQVNQRQILFHDCSIFLCLFVDPPIINLRKNIFFTEELSGRHAAEASGLTVKILLFTKRKITQYRMKGSVPLFGSHYSIAFAGRTHTCLCS